MTATEERKPQTFCLLVGLFFFPKSAPKFVSGADKSKRTRLQLSRSGVPSQPLRVAAAAPAQAPSGCLGLGELVPSAR